MPDNQNPNVISLVDSAGNTNYGTNPAPRLDAKPGPYLTQLNPTEEQQFRTWASDPQNNSQDYIEPKPDADYDARGFWKAMQSGDPVAKRAVSDADGKLHAPDVWKTPYHRSFSQESMYATPEAPSWNDKDQLLDKSGKVVWDDRDPKNFNESTPPYRPTAPIIINRNQTFDPSKQQPGRQIPATPAPSPSTLEQIGQKLTEPMMPVIVAPEGSTPEEISDLQKEHAGGLVVSQGYAKQHPYSIRLGQNISQMTSPAMAGMMWGTELVGAAGAVGKAISSLVGAGFTADQTLHLYHTVPEIKKAIDAGDMDTAKKLMADATVDVAFAGAGALHAGHEIHSGLSSLGAEVPLHQDFLDLGAEIADSGKKFLREPFVENPEKEAIEKAKDVGYHLVNPPIPEYARGFEASTHRLSESPSGEIRAKLAEAGIRAGKLEPDMQAEMEEILGELPKIGAREYRIIDSTLKGDLSDPTAVADKMREQLGLSKESKLKSEPAEEEEPTLAPNASGESAASQEAINRAASEKAQGQQRVRIDTRSGKETPLIGVDAVDAKAGPFDRIVMREEKGDTTLDEGAHAMPESAKTPEVTPEKESESLENPNVYELGDEEAPAASPNETLQESAQKYASAKGMEPIDHSPVEQDPDRARAIAQHYQQVEHAPNDPKVREAYDALKKETKDQFHHLRDDLGLKFEPQAEDPYKSAGEMMDDVRKNNRLKVFTGSGTQPDHPMSEIDPETGENYTTLFRWVHDAMGHAAGGHDFSENGEKSATEAHAQMYGDKARPAMRHETEGQTSWFFHNPDVESGAKPVGEFAEQKANILPDDADLERQGIQSEEGDTSFKPEEPQSISDRLKETYGKTNDHLGAGFILKNGDMVPLRGEHNTMLDTLYSKYGDISQGDAERTAFINNEKAVRTRYRTTKAGKELVFSVPKDGVTPEQVDQIRQSIGKMGRNGNAVIEVSEGQGKSVRKEFVSPSHVEDMLREVGAHPDQNWHQSVSDKMETEPAGAVDPKTGKEAIPEGATHALEVYPESRQRFANKPSGAQIKAFTEANQALFDKHPELRVGWDFDGTNHPDKPWEMNIGAAGSERGAIGVGQKLDQRAAFHPESGKDVPLGGKNQQTAFPDYPLEQRLADLKGEGPGSTPASAPNAPKMPTSALQKTMNAVVENAYGTYSLDQVKNGDPWISPADKEVGEKPAWKDGDSGFVHHDGSVSFVGGAFMHDPFLERLGEGFDAQEFRKATNSATFDIFDTRGHGAGEPHILSATFAQPPTPEQMQALTAMTQHLRAGSENFQKVDVSWPSKNISIDFATPGKVMRELKQATEPTGTLRENPLNVKATGENGNVLLLDLAKALQQSITKTPEGKTAVQHAVDQALPELKYQVAQENSGLHWYQADVDTAMKEFTKIHPELKGATSRKLFSAFWTAMSYGHEPHDNLSLADKAYNLYKKTGEFPVTQEDGKAWGAYAAAHSGNMNTMQKLLDKHGERGMIDWMLQKHSIKELRDFNPNVKGKQGDMEYGARVLGEKGGNFFLNLNGVEDVVTVDKWMTRMWRRWQGTLTTKNVDDAPSMQEIKDARTAVTSVGKELGIAPRDAQAALWHYEQEMYKQHGVDVEPRNYANGAKEYVQRVLQSRGDENPGTKSKASGKAAKPSQPTQSSGKGKGPAKASKPVAGKSTKSGASIGQQLTSKKTSSGFTHQGRMVKKEALAFKRYWEARGHSVQLDEAQKGKYNVWLKLAAAGALGLAGTLTQAQEGKPQTTLPRGTAAMTVTANSGPQPIDATKANQAAAPKAKNQTPLLNAPNTYDKNSFTPDMFPIRPKPTLTKT